MQIWGETKDCGMDIYYYGMDDFLKSITIESCMHITKAYIKNCYFVLNQKVVARLLHLIFLRKILARKPATFHIQTRCEQFKPTLPILTENRMLKNVELNSKRLKTRNLNEGDIEKLFKIYSDKEPMKFRGSKPMNKIADASKMIFDQTIEKNNIIKIRKAIIKKENKELIGTLLLECDKSFPNRCEIGFSFEKSEWNNGYGKETLDMVLEKLKTINSIKEVKAWCIKKNIAS